MQLARHLMETEVHVYAFSMAANVLLSFYPFLLVMISFTRHVLGWRAAEQAIYLAVNDYFPNKLGAFIARNLKATIMQSGPLQVTSLLLLLFAANGIFEPLEVALNRAWGISKNRSYVHNQLISLGLIFACGGLALASMSLTAFNQEIWKDWGFAGTQSDAATQILMFKVAAAPVSILALFLVYWLLPNGKVSAASSLRVAVVVGLLLEGLKYVNLVTWPYFRDKLNREYGPFDYAVMIVLWSFFSSMIVLAGAWWAAQTARGPELQSTLVDDNLKLESDLEVTQNGPKQ